MSESSEILEIGVEYFELKYDQGVCNIEFVPILSEENDTFENLLLVTLMGLKAVAEDNEIDFNDLILSALDERVLN